MTLVTAKFIEFVVRNVPFVRPLLTKVSTLAVTVVWVAKNIGSAAVFALIFAVFVVLATIAKIAAIHVFAATACAVLTFFVLRAPSFERRRYLVAVGTVPESFVLFSFNVAVFSVAQF